ncbi:MAG: hypothetical protein PUB96_02185 [Helicobacteraceae bacterium]|nr:hypothetical protein [Helicobacteraceae bacterium]
MKNYWPLGIFLFSLVVVGLIVLTLKTALSNPVELQKLCGFSSQRIDENANEIEIKRKAFLEKYAVGFLEDSAANIKLEAQNFHNLKLSLIDKENHAVPEAKVTFFLTRPHTTKEDLDLGSGILNESFIYESKSFEALKKGRWIEQALVEVGEDSICVTNEVFLK